MARYIVTRRYSSWRDGQSYGPWSVGAVVEMSDHDAEWVNRDSPGVLRREEVEPDDTDNPTSDDDEEPAAEPDDDAEQGDADASQPGADDVDEPAVEKTVQPRKRRGRS